MTFFLSIQLIYEGKTKKSLPRIKLPTSFALSVNPKKYNNEKKVIKTVK